jgi:uncharacterized membrane protein
MNGEPVTYTRVRIRPVECIKEGWNYTKDQYWLLMAIALVGMLLAGVTYYIIIGPMMCGIYMAFLSRLRGEPARFDQLWRGFDYFIPSLLVLLVLIAVMLVVVTPIFIVAMASVFAFAADAAANDGSSDLYTVFIPLWSVLFVIYFAVVTLSSVLFIFVFPLLVDKGLRPMDALWLGIRAAAAHFGGLLGLYLIIMAMGLIGMLFCYIGAFLVMPIQFAAMAVAYRKVFPEGAPVVEGESASG